MICRRCLQRAPGLARDLSKPPPSAIRLRAPLRPFSQTIASRSSSPSAPSDAAAAVPPLGTPLADGGGADPKPAAAAALSSCPEGTVLTGLNYFKNKADPVAMADDAYPEWLWRCLDVQKRADEQDADDAGDEFSKSKKQRRLAAKRQRALEARLLAEGNLEALAPKIPLQQQSVNLPANEAGTVEGAVAAAAVREELRRAMRRERKAKIKESNYLRSM
ncbi:hypothetical protein DL766_008503 [Monosporascus sp. MC13-8B]|nr:hypothetical protein DL763_006025 [Monosporascus cannonballus]RYP19151.1 hypothetical protein DL766_008503 [Monosporascus sp. MC13-8B]